MKNIHLILTDKLSKLGRFIDTNNLFIRTFNDIPRGENVNIYITSDEEIKEGDYVCASGGFRFVKTLNNDKGRTFKDDGIVSKQNPSSSCHLSNYKKVILTTDQDLIKDGVQAIDDEFLEWFVKNPSCEEVETYSLGVKNQLTGERGHYKYEIIIPKEEPLTKLQIAKNIAAIGIGKKEPKQETLEEAALRFYPKVITDPYNPSEDLLKEERTIFIEGAKWQAKRMYSEEDMIEFGFSTYCYISELMGVPFNLISENRLNAELWFEQFKKK